jgi:glycine/D-amino acid oxidase-like deaminating enzyme
MLELAEAVVVGGGVLGLAVTEALSRRFSRVLLVEAARCGSRATSGGFAWVNASSKWTDRTYHLLNAQACRRHIALAAEHDSIRTGWNGGGSLMWVSASDRSEFARLLDRIETLQSWEYPATRLSRAEMQALEPNLVFPMDAVGLFCPSEGWVSTARLTRFYLDQARVNHAEIAEHTRVTGFTLDYKGDIASVETTGGRVSTRMVVLCAGTEVEALASLARGQARERPCRLLTRSPGLLVEAGPLPASAVVHRVCYPAAAGSLHIRPTFEGGVLVGAEDTDIACEGATSTLEGAGPAPDRLSDMSAGLMRRATAVLPALDPNTPVSARCCTRPIPIDGLPIVGELPGVGGAYLLASHSGVTLGPMLGELMADEIITGRPSPWLSPFRPARLFR